MSTTYNNPVSNMSYTNRDFATIFPELLDLAKKLTSRWDPSVSNESDPGVVLLKLNAIIADKLNYNIDKNVLECFPLSVTQRSNARQLYKQLGYTMGYYKSAMTTVVTEWSDLDTVQDSDYYATIPAFTMVTDVDNTVVYALLGPVLSDGTISISEQQLPLDGSSVTWNAMQGIPTKYSINSSEVITADMLDENNRLYFDTTDVAENGIFITHTNGANDFSLWKKVDNLLTVMTNDSDTSEVTYYYYSFGVTADENSCYIEFTTDALDIFRNGIEITYMRTAALDGNIAYNFLSKFDSNITPETNYTESSITLSDENVKIANITASYGAADVESLSDAYRSYQSTVGTYNTLITLRDYINACINGEYASNGYVCSRNNDIQESFKVMSFADLAHTSLNVVDSGDCIAPDREKMNAFNLKMYLTGYVDSSIKNSTDYNSTFSLLDNSSLSAVQTYLEDQKSIEHEFLPVISPYTSISKFGGSNGQFVSKWDCTTGTPVTEIGTDSYTYSEGDFYIISKVNTEAQDGATYPVNYMPNGSVYRKGSTSTTKYEGFPDVDEVFYYDGDNWVHSGKIVYRSNVALYKAMCPINARVTSTSTLTNAEKEDLVSNIRSAIYDNFAARKIVIGAMPDASDVSKVIQEADSRVYSVYVDDIVPNVCAVYWNGSQFRTVDLSKPEILNIDFKEIKDSDPDVVDTDYNLTYFVSCNTDGLDPIPVYKEVDSVYVDEFANVVGNTAGWARYDFTYNGMSSEGFYRWTMTTYYGGTSSKRQDSSISISGDISTGDTISKYLSMDLGKIADNTVITVEVNPLNLIKKEIICKSILAGVTPFYIEDDEFYYDVNQMCVAKSVYDKPSSVTKTELPKYKYVNTIKATADIELPVGTALQLNDNENLQFFAPNLLTKESYSDYVKYEAYIAGTSSITSIPAGSSYLLKDGDYVVFYWKDSTDDIIYKYHIYGAGYILCPTFDIERPTGSGQSSTSIALNSKMLAAGVNEYSYKQEQMTQTMSSVVDNLTSSKYYLSGSSSISMQSMNVVTLDNYAKVYWVLNAKSNGKYVLFNEGDTEPYTLGSGEYFIYADTALSELQFLGSGTKIERSGNTSEWSVDAIDSDEITKNGTTALSSIWFTFPSKGITIDLTEQQFVSLSSGVWVRSTKYNYSNTPTAVSETGSEDMTSLNVFPVVQGSYTSELGSAADIKVTSGTTVIYGVFASEGAANSGSLEGMTFYDTKKAVVTHEWKDSDSINYYYVKGPFNDNTKSIQSDETIQYCTDTVPGTDNWTSLSKLILSSGYNWEARSLLSLNVGSTSYQRLESNHKVYFTQLGHSDQFEIDGVPATIWSEELQKYVSNPSYPMCFMSSIDIISSGKDGFMDVYDLDDYGNRVYPTLYSFTKLTPTTTMRYSDTGGASIYLLGSNMSTESIIHVNFSFALPKVDEGGGIILTLYNPYSDVNSLTITEEVEVGGESQLKLVYKINDPDVTDFKDSGVYNLAFTGITKNDTTTVNADLKFVCATMKKTDTRVLTLNKAFRYYSNEDFIYPISTIQELLTNNFDIDGNFDYTYSIDDSSKIDDPIASSSFLKASHIYNKNTICQMDSSNILLNIYGGKS